MNTSGFVLLLVGSLLALACGSLVWGLATNKKLAYLGLFLWIASLGVIIFLFVHNGIYPSTAQVSVPSQTQSARVVQKLLRGEGVPIEQYTTIPVLAYAAEKELKLPTNVVAKIGDYRRYTLHFNTNDALSATNR